MDKEIAFEDTEMHSLELELKEYKKFFDDTPVAFMRTDMRTGKFLMANNYCATLLGYDSVEELMKRERKSSLYPREHRQRLIQKIKKEGSVEGYEIQLQLKNGKIVWVSAWLHINCGGSCIEGTLIDITAQKEAEFQLEALRCEQLVRMQCINEKLDERLDNYAK